MNHCDSCDGQCEYDEAEAWYKLLNRFEDDGAMRVLETYLELHRAKIGQHWLWCVIERIANGEMETDVLEEFGYVYYDGDNK